MQHEKIKRALLAIFTAAALAGCGGDGNSGFSPTVPPSDATGTTADTSPSPSGDGTTPASNSATEIEIANFARVAPADKALDDPNIYDTTKNGNIALGSINEDSSVKRHTIVLNGQTLPYTARAGHLVAYDLKSSAATASALADGTTAPSPKPEAAIFYTSYTRDGLPKEDRPITFLWNGGPGSASIWLHMGSWGPKRLKSDAPNMPDRTVQPASFPFVDNDISLLSQSDIVFVDPPGTGYSTAIAPSTNGDLWGTDIDAQVVAEFIIAYVNKYSRQSSPKYLYGESYGGIRTPIVANLLEQAGTSSYAPDPSGKPAKVLAGFILNSPLINYNSNCNMAGSFTPPPGAPAVPAASCAGYIPSYAMAADYLKRSTKRGNLTQEEYLDRLRTYTKTTYLNALKTASAFDQSTFKPNDGYPAWAKSKAGQEALGELSAYVGIDLTSQGKISGFQMDPITNSAPIFGFDDYWGSISFNLQPITFQSYVLNNPNKLTGRYDARMYVSWDSSFPPDNYIDAAFLNQANSYFPEFVNYRTKSAYQPINHGPLTPKEDGSVTWNFQRAGFDGYLPQSITDIQAVLTANPDSKMLVIHGYEDIATPGFQTELDLEGANLQKRVPVKWFEGGHMTYNTEASRAPLSKVINDFYIKPVQDAAGAHVTSYSNVSALQ